MNKSSYDQQVIRKSNLQKLITEKLNDNVDEFAKKVGKHRNFIYALLWDINHPNNRSISDKMVRYLEQSADVEPSYLDGFISKKTELLDFTELQQYRQILNEIIELQNLMLINHDKIKTLIK